MIEVEKQFIPTEEQLRVLLADAEFIGEVTNYDICYDYIDFRLFKKGISLRFRNNSFELKISKSDIVREEIEVKKDIEKYFNTSNIEEFIRKNLIVFSEYATKRIKYKKEDFNIDVDETSFGYKILEIELMVEREDQTKDAENKIINLAKKYNLGIKKVPSKRSEYFRRFKPEIYKELYANK